jgi:hypothetical protein
VPASGRGFIAAERWKAIDYAKESGPRQADVSPPGTIAAGHGSPHEGLEEAAVTNYMIVKQKVRDLAAFQKAFDGLAAERRAAGLVDLGQFVAADERDTVIVVMEATDLARAKAYWHSAVLAQGRERAGVVGAIEAKSDQVWLTDGLVRTRIGKS